MRHSRVIITIVAFTLALSSFMGAGAACGEIARLSGQPQQPESAAAASRARSVPGAKTASTGGGQALFINSAVAKEHLGEMVKVCGTIASVRSGKRMNYLNIGADFPRQHLGVAISVKNQPSFEAALGPLKAFAGRQLCATGKLRSQKGQPVLDVYEPQALELSGN